MSKNVIIDSYLNQFTNLNFLEKAKLMNVLKVIFMTERSVLVFTMFFMCPTGCNPIEHSLLYSQGVHVFSQSRPFDFRPNDIFHLNSKQSDLVFAQRNIIHHKQKNNILIINNVLYNYI